MKSTIQDKTQLVNSVFSRVYKKYDLMNDIMSLGVHRIWKGKLIDWMNPQLNESLIDVASGTGDIAKLFSKKNNNSAQITCVAGIYILLWAEKIISILSFGSSRAGVVFSS